MPSIAVNTNGREGLDVGLEFETDTRADWPAPNQLWGANPIDS